MKMWKRKLLRFAIFAILVGCYCLISCTAEQQYLQSPSGKSVIATGESIANAAVTAAASAYGGPLAGQLAGAGLNALASVLQGYIDRPVPASIVKASPGVNGVGPAVAPLVPTAPITQKDVNIVYQAASIAAKK